MRKLADICEAIAATTKKLQKIALVADYLKSQPVEEAAVAAVFLSGRPFPAWEERTLQVGSRLLWQVIGESSGRSDEEMSAAYRKLGDLGAVAREVLQQVSADGAEVAAPKGDELSAAEVQQAFRQI
ncbi:MAG TPA: hypothetical protein VK466_06100, partial [Terriglobales bacterium]|nr:hypothetical protein [Terriglobales bacterium]